MQTLSCSVPVRASLARCRDGRLILLAYLNAERMPFGTPLLDRSACMPGTPSGHMGINLLHQTRQMADHAGMPCLPLRC